MGKVILMQSTVDWIYQVDENAIVRLQKMGIPEPIETNSGLKYYRYD